MASEKDTFPQESEELLGKELSSSADFGEGSSAAEISIDIESGESKSPEKPSSPAPSEPSGEQKAPSDNSEESSSSAPPAESGETSPANVQFGPENRPETPQLVLPWDDAQCDLQDLELECFGPLSPSVMNIRLQEANSEGKRLKINGKLAVQRRTHCHITLLQNELLEYLSSNIESIYRPDLDHRVPASPWLHVQRLAARLYHPRSKFSNAAAFYLERSSEGVKKRLNNLDKKPSSWGQVDPKTSDSRPLTVTTSDEGRSVEPPQKAAPKNQAPEPQAARNAPKFNPDDYPEDIYDSWMVNRCAPQKPQKNPFWNPGSRPSPLVPPTPMSSTGPAPMSASYRRPQAMAQQQNIPPVGSSWHNWPLPTTSAATTAGTMPKRRRRR